MCSSDLWRQREVQIRSFFKQIEVGQGSAKQGYRFIAVAELFAQPIEFETAVLGDDKALALEAREDGSHSTKRGKRDVIGMLH